MSPRSILFVAISLSLVSCDKAKKIADQAKAAVESRIAEKTGSSAAAPDAQLQKLVDQTPEGVIFRKDLPFPKNLEVRTTVREEIVGRSFQTSAIEKHSEDVKGTKTVITRLERAGDQIRYTLEQSSFAAPVVEGAKEGASAVPDAAVQIAPASKPMTFVKSGKTWKCSATDGFRAAALSRQLAPVFDQLLVDNALAGRALWFGPRRFRNGDQITISGSTLPMLVTGEATGSFTLTFDKTEAVEGHPCGVFKVTGDFSRRNFPDFEGNSTDQEVTIESGTMWLSLIHPIIIKQELNTIQTTRSGGQGGQSERGQGKIKATVTREWKPK